MAIQGPALPGKKHLPYGGARAINNHVITEFINFVLGKDFQQQTKQPDIVDDFLDNYVNWLSNSKINLLTGFDKFPYKTYANGTTEVFDKWYIRYKHRRLRIFRGEYMYHFATYRNLDMPYKWLEDEPLKENDHVIISLPFADSGNIRHETISILNTAVLLNVPVLIDAAYLGLTHNLEFDFSHPAIDTIAVSLSKTFPVAHLRIGMRLMREDYDDGLDIYHKTGYQNRWGATLGNQLITNYSIDYNPTCYEHWQRFKCQEMNLRQSKTILFGLGGDEYKQYNRGGLYNRLFLGDFYEQSI
jgi:hypothetical protein